MIDIFVEIKSLVCSNTLTMLSNLAGREMSIFCMSWTSLFCSPMEVNWLVKAIILSVKTLMSHFHTSSDFRTLYVTFEVKSNGLEESLDILSLMHLTLLWMLMLLQSMRRYDPIRQFVKFAKPMYHSSFSNRSCSCCFRGLIQLCWWGSYTFFNHGP